VSRVATAVHHSTVVLQHADLAVAVAAADVIVIHEMIEVGHAPPAAVTDATTTGAVTVETDTRGGTADTEAEIDVVHPAGHRQNQRTSRSS